METGQWLWPANIGKVPCGRPSTMVSKRNILRMLSARGCKVTVLPAQASAADAIALKPDGIFLSNGPG